MRTKAVFGFVLVVGSLGMGTNEANACLFKRWHAKNQVYSARPSTIHTRMGRSWRPLKHHPECSPRHMHHLAYRRLHRLLMKFKKL